jgi:hypothetical protein
MGILDPSKEDQRDEKKPRFLQDIAVVLVVVALLLIYAVLEIFVF